MKIALGHSFGVKLCEALGIDPSTVTGIDIRCHVGDPVTVTVHSFLLDDVDLVSTLSEFVLVDKAEALAPAEG